MEKGIAHITYDSGSEHKYTWSLYINGERSYRPFAVSGRAFDTQEQATKDALRLAGVEIVAVSQQVSNLDAWVYGGLTFHRKYSILTKSGFSVCCV